MLDLVIPAIDIGMAIAKWSAVILGPLKALQMIGNVVANVGVWFSILFVKLNHKKTAPEDGGLSARRKEWIAHRRTAIRLLTNL
jgi:hypothetical protein